MDRLIVVGVTEADTNSVEEFKYSFVSSGDRKIVNSGIHISQSPWAKTKCLLEGLLKWIKDRMFSYIYQ